MYPTVLYIHRQALNGLILILGPVSAANAADDDMVGGKLGGMSNEDELACFACEGHEATTTTTTLVV